MDFTSHFTPLAQAYVIEGNARAIERELLVVLEEAHRISFAGNPDVWKGSYATFAIEHAREIKDLASKKKIGEGKRAFVISADAMTREASNALLKTLEEPGEGTHFFLIVPSAKRMLPTILSRARIVKHAGASSFELTPASFLAQSPAERLASIKEILARLDKEEITKGDISSFIEDIVRTKHQKGGGSLEKAAMAAGFARDQSASLKMVLEYLALTA